MEVDPPTEDRSPPSSSSRHLPALCSSHRLLCLLRLQLDCSTVLTGFSTKEETFFMIYFLYFFIYIFSLSVAPSLLFNRRQQ